MRIFNSAVWCHDITLFTRSHATIALWDCFRALAQSPGLIVGIVLNYDLVFNCI